MRFRSINFKISLLVSIVVALVIACLVIYVARSSYSGVLETQAANMKEICKELKTTISNFYDDSLGIARSLSKQDTVLQGLEGWTYAPVAQTLEKEIASFPNLVGLLLFDGQGQVIARTGDHSEDNSGGAVKSQPYFTPVLQGSEYIQDSASWNKAKNMMLYYVAAPVRDSSGKVVGGVLAALNWSGFSDRFINPFSIGQGGYPFVQDKDGVMVSHRSKELHLVNMTGKTNFQEAMYASNDGFQTYEWEGKSKAMVWTTLERTGWKITCSAYEDDLASTAVRQRQILIIVGIIAVVLLAAIIVLCLQYFLFQPMKRIRQFTSQVAQGDYQAKLSGRFRDEMADLSNDISTMVGVLKERLSFSDGVIKAISQPMMVIDKNERLTYVNEHYLNLFEHTGKKEQYLGKTLAWFFYGDETKKTNASKVLQEKKAIIAQEMEARSAKGKELIVHYDIVPLYNLEGEASGAFLMFKDMTEIKRQQKQIEAQNKRIAAAAKEANDVAEMVATASEELSAQIDQSSRGTEEQGNRTGEAASAMEEMNASVLEVAKNASNAAQSAEEAKKKALDGDRVVEDVISTISEVNEQSKQMKEHLNNLGRQADDIGKIMVVISDIADQTNLLALNAAIEAARAGDAGRGFAVVADEVRKLAEKTMTATKEVGDAVQSIQQGAQANINSMEKTSETIVKSTEMAGKAGEALHEILAIVEATADQVRSIATASEQQSAASEEINRSMEDINRIASETAEAMNQSAQAVTELANMSGKLKQIMDDLIQ